MMRRKLAIAAALVIAFALGALTSRVLLGGRDPLADKWRDHCSMVRSALETDAYALRQQDHPAHRDFVADRLLADEALPYHRIEDAMECGDQDVARQAAEADACRARSDFACLERVAHEAARSISEAPP